MDTQEIMSAYEGYKGWMVEVVNLTAARWDGADLIGRLGMLSVGAAFLSIGRVLSLEEVAIFRDRIFCATLTPEELELWLEIVNTMKRMDAELSGAESQGV